jgi:hypothetical protein
MHDDDLRDDISRLEAKIEELADKIERCRKFMLIARAAIAFSAGLIVAMAIGLIQFDGLPILTSLSLLLGGIVALGTNSSTLDEANVALKAAEAQRAQLIGRIDLRLVSETPEIRRINGHA